MKHVVDSCGWLEWFADSGLAEAYGDHLRDVDRILVPAIVLYEVYIILKREIGEEKALLGAGYMKQASVVSINENLALKATDVALQHRLAMADAMVYATSVLHACHLYTSDADLKDLPGVIYIPVRNRQP